MVMGSSSVFAESIDPRRALEVLAQLARQHSVDLDGLIDIDSNSIGGGSAYVRLGILRPEGSKVVVKIARGGPPENVDTIKVRVLFTDQTGLIPRSYSSC